MDYWKNTVKRSEGWYVTQPGVDPMTHWISGRAIHGETPFNMPLITLVQENLWQGGFVNGIDLGDRFDVVVSLYPWKRYPTTGITREYTMLDGMSVDVYTLGRAVGEVEHHLDRDKKVLVHCQAGLNRSALVVARVLMRQGLTADESIALLRARRSPAVLCNPTFEAWLRANPCDTR